MPKLPSPISVTRITHGADAAEAASTEAGRLFGDTDQSRREAAAGLQTVELCSEELSGGGTPIVQLLVKSGLSSTGKEARRLIASGGARMNGEKITDTSACVSIDMLAEPIELSAGRKRHVRIALTDQ